MSDAVPAARLVDGGNLAIVGLAVVFVALLVLAFVIGLVRKMDERWQRDERRAADAALERAPTIDALTLVLVSAAVATWLGGRFRIRRVRLLGAAAPSSPWSAQGRLVLMGSHVLRRGR